MDQAAQHEPHLRWTDPARVSVVGRAAGVSGGAAAARRAARGAVRGRVSTTTLRQLDTHRLIPAKFTENDDSVLNRIAEDERHLADLFDLDHATNDRLLAENGQLPGIARHELVFGVPSYRIVNATFTHAHPLGGRFNAPDRGAWYAGFELETSLAEVAFHKSVEYAEIERFDDSVV